MRFNDLNEMDSQGYSGSRDRKSSSKYGSRDDYELGQPEVTLGADSIAKPKDVVKHGVSALHKALDSALSKEKKASPAQVERNKLRWAQRQQEREQGVAESAGNVGNSIKSLYQKIYNAGDDEIEYFYNDSPIFAQYWDEYEGDLDSIIAEVDPKELQIMHDELESYVQQANLAEANPTMTVNKKSALSQAVAEAGWGSRYTSYHDELSSRDRDEQNYMDQSKRAFKRAEMQHELGHEDDPNFERNFRQQQIDRDRGPWYIRIDGKIYKQKGIAKSFDWKRGANNYALAMIKNNPSLQGKVMLSKSAEDK